MSKLRNAALAFFLTEGGLAAGGLASHYYQQAKIDSAPDTLEGYLGRLQTENTQGLSDLFFVALAGILVAPLGVRMAKANDERLRNQAIAAESTDPRADLLA